MAEQEILSGFFSYACDPQGAGLRAEGRMAEASARLSQNEEFS
jgi:hypothetical protein